MLLSQCAAKAKRLESDCQAWREDCRKGTNVALWLLPSAAAAISTLKEVEHRQSVLIPLLARSLEAESEDEEVVLKNRCFLAAFRKWTGVVSKLFSVEGKVVGTSGEFIQQISSWTRSSQCRYRLYFLV
jgi:hypothetical protein